MKHINILISGELQEKGFRFAAMDKAYQLEIAGYVRRKRDGRIYIEAEGESAKVDEYVEWCRKGPLGCIVYNVQVEEAQLREFKGFDIKRR